MSGTAQPWADPRRFLRLVDDPWFRLVVALQDRVSVATTGFWSARGLRTMHLPVTTHAVSSPMGLGSDSLPVRVDLFGVPTYLADSMQFMLEYGCRLWPSGVYYVMPSFRGEAADPTHLCQFFHSEAEIPGGLDDVIAVAGEYLRHLCVDLLDALGPELAAVVGDVRHVEALAGGQQPVRLTFDEACAQLDDGLVRTDEGGWRTLTRAGELALLDRHGAPVWVTHFDHLAVPFYQAYADPAGRSAANADLLLGLGELIGAGQRHTDAASAEAALAHHGVDAEPYRWYLDLKAERPMPTSGFGMGVERFLAWVLRHDDVRDLQVLPRVNGVACVP